MDGLAKLFREVEFCSEDEQIGEEMGDMKETYGLRNKCRGCGKDFVRHLGHLSARGGKCRENYTAWELKDYQQETGKEARKKYREHKKVDIEEYETKYYKEVQICKEKFSEMSMSLGTKMTNGFGQSSTVPSLLFM